MKQKIVMAVGLFLFFVLVFLGIMHFLLSLGSKPTRTPVPVVTMTAERKKPALVSTEAPGVVKRPQPRVSAQPEPEIDKLLESSDLKNVNFWGQLDQAIGVDEGVIIINQSTQMLGLVSKQADGPHKLLLLAECSTGRRSRRETEKYETPDTVNGGIVKYTEIIEKEGEHATQKYGTMNLAMQLKMLSKEGKQELFIHQGVIHGLKTDTRGAWSHGCVRLMKDNAQTLFSKAAKGTKVVIFGSIEEFYSHHFDPDNVVVWKNGKARFKCQEQNATQEDKDKFFELVKDHKVQIDHLDSRGNVTTDKNVVRFRFESMHNGEGMTVAEFERMFNQPINLRPYRKN